MALYDQLHVFIDESGDFINLKRNDELLLGGVFFWGDYNEEQAGDPKVDWDLKELILGAMHETYEQSDTDRLDYRNLHYHERSLINAEQNDQSYWNKKNFFLAKVREGLFNGSYWDRLGGFVLKHVADVYGASGDVLSEDFLDNRYQRMLELLIESLLIRALYLDENRLSKDGSVHFHIAHRYSVWEYHTSDERDEIIAQLKKRGVSEGQYRIEKKSGQERGCGTISISSLLNREELSAKVNQLVGNLQDVYDVNLKPHISIEQIVYENQFMKMANGPARSRRVSSFELRDSKLSLMGYYLADNFLGQYRKGYDEDRLIVPFDSRFYSWAYVDTTQFINRTLINLQNQSSEYFWHTICQSPEVARKPDFTNFLTNLSAEGADVIMKGYSIALDRICEDVDNPELGKLIHFRKVYCVFQEIDGILRQKNPNKYSQTLNDYLELTNYRVRITLANHLGRPFEAFQAAQSYQELIKEPERNVFAAFSTEKELEFRTDMALRCEVAYVDQFDYQNAKNELEDFVALQEKTFKFYNDLTIPGKSSIPRKSLSLGRCYGALGQIYAFQGDCKTAVQFLNKAIRHFDAEAFLGDIQRDLIYLGHVACDMARDADNDAARAEAVELWERVSHDLNLPSWDNLAELEKLADENRYTFALIVKAMAFFATQIEIRRFLNAWASSSPLFKRINDASNKTSFEHPYELICQSIGILWERSVGVDVSEDVRMGAQRRAIQYYNHGYDISQNGGEIIGVLGLASKARALLASNSEIAEWRAWNRELEKLFARFNPERIDAVFGANRGAIAEEQEFATSDEYRAKAEKFIQAIRFNYW